MKPFFLTVTKVGYSGSLGFLRDDFTFYKTPRGSMTEQSMMKWIDDMLVPTRKVLEFVRIRKAPNRVFVSVAPESYASNRAPAGDGRSALRASPCAIRRGLAWVADVRLSPGPPNHRNWWMYYAE